VAINDDPIRVDAGKLINPSEGYNPSQLLQVLTKNVL
jgi:hypothetical protein